MLTLPNEGSGVIHTTETMGETELACSAFGQGFTCTMIQEINAMCSVINGGYYYQPHLVTAIKDSRGGIVKTIDLSLWKQTISSEIQADIRSYMAPVYRKVPAVPPKYRDTVQEVRPVQRKNFLEETRNMWFPYHICTGR